MYLGRRLRNAVVGRSRGYGKGSSVYSVESVVGISPISPSHVCVLAMRKMLWRRREKGSIKKWEILGREIELKKGLWYDSGESNLSLCVVLWCGVVLRRELRWRVFVSCLSTTLLRVEVKHGNDLLLMWLTKTHFFLFYLSQIIYFTQLPFFSKSKYYVISLFSTLKFVHILFKLWFKYDYILLIL